MILIEESAYISSYLVKDSSNTVFELKVLDIKDRPNNSTYRNILLEETNIMQKLDHPAIPKIVDIIEDENSIFIVKEHFEGGILEEIAQTHGARPADMVVEWGKQICGVLSYLHSQNPPLIYRDMKPSNVLLSPDGTIKIIDFGCVRTYKRNKKSDTIQLGTHGYAAPEQFGGAQTDIRTDIFGLGMTMYRLVTGIDPTNPMFELNPISVTNPKLPKGLEYIITKCTKPNPAERYQSCAELMVDLNNYTILPKSNGVVGKLLSI